MQNGTKPTISELASRLSLSKGTVSRILNDKGNAFSEETRQRVFTVAREIGYAPNPLARALATGKSGFVALWVQTLSTSYHAQIAHTMEEALEKLGYQIAVTPFGRLDRNRERYTGTPAGVDGMIAHEIYGDIWPLLFRHSSKTVPVVTTGILAPRESRDHVQVTITQAGYDMAEHLVSTKRERIAYVSDQMFQRTSDVRFRAYCDVVSSNGLPLEFIDLPAGERETARVAIREYVAAQGCPGVMYCHNDDIAIAAYRALCDLGLNIPQDCVLAGCDGIPDTEYLPVPITTIIQPFAEIGTTACRFLQHRLDNPDAPPQRAELSAKLVVRGSSQL